MPNIPESPGYEVDSGWDFFSGALRENLGSGAHGGDWVGTLLTRSGIAPKTQVIQSHVPATAADPGNLNLYVWWKLNASSAQFAHNWKLRFQVYEDDTSDKLLHTSPWFYTDQVTADEWQQYAATEIVPHEVTRKYYVRTETSWDSDLHVGTATFHVDDWVLLLTAEDVEVAKRRDIKDAVEALLAGITTANGFQQDVGEVLGELKRPDAITSWPALQCIYGDERRQHGELHRKFGTLQIHILVYTRDTETKNAAEVSDDLANDVEIRLETQSGAQFLGLGYVEQVTVSEIAPFEAGDAVEQNWRVAIVTVDVKYRYDRLAP